MAYLGARVKAGGDETTRTFDPTNTGLRSEQRKTCHNWIDKSAVNSEVLSPPPRQGWIPAYRLRIYFRSTAPDTSLSSTSGHFGQFPRPRPLVPTHRGGDCRKLIVLVAFMVIDFFGGMLRHSPPLTVHRQPNADLPYPRHHCLHHSRFTQSNLGHRNRRQGDPRVSVRSLAAAFLSSVSTSPQSLSTGILAGRSTASASSAPSVRSSNSPLPSMELVFFLG